MQLAGYRPRDFAYCGLIAAYSLAGQHDRALSVRGRARTEGLQPSVHVYNASLAVCERVGNVELALELLQCMHKEVGAESKPHVLLLCCICCCFFRNILCTCVMSLWLVGCALSLWAKVACSRQGDLHSIIAIHLTHSFSPPLVVSLQGVEPNFVTHQLMTVLGRQGVQSVEQQQLAAATLSAICAAAGSLLIKIGLF